MWAPMMYISSGCVVPPLVQNTSSRGPGVSGSALMRRSAVSGCSSGLVLPPVGPRPPFRGRAGRGGRGGDAPERRGGRQLRMGVDPGGPTEAFPREGGARGRRAGTRRRGVARGADLPAGELVMDSLGVGATVALELGLDPIHRGAVSLSALAAIAELREPADRRLVPLEIEPAGELPDRIVWLGLRRGLGQSLCGGRRCRRPGSRRGPGPGRISRRGGTASAGAVGGQGAPPGGIDAPHQRLRRR